MAIPLTPDRPQTDPATAFAIADTLHRMYHALDTRDWQRLESCFTPNVYTDFTSLLGGLPETEAAPVLTNKWKALSSGFDSAMHSIVNGWVTYDRMKSGLRTAGYAANMRTSGVLQNDLGLPPIWGIEGRYYYDLVLNYDHWLVAGITVQLHVEHGDRQLLNLAIERAMQTTESVAA